jgi:hypothetical protein
VEADRPHATVADVVRRYGGAFRAWAGTVLSTAQRRVMTAIAQCRTAALGGHAEQCDQCGHRRVWYNSCRNRHCPMCQAHARAVWVTQRQTELLDCPYFHVVFTVPEPIAQIALQNKAVVYGILFRATAETLVTIAADPRHLGAAIGCIAVLHTWGQTLVHHPHLLIRPIVLAASTAGVVGVLGNSCPSRSTSATPELPSQGRFSASPKRWTIATAPPRPPAIPCRPGTATRPAEHGAHEYPGDGPRQAVIPGQQLRHVVHGGVIVWIDDAE